MIYILIIIILTLSGCNNFINNENIQISKENNNISGEYNSGENLYNILIDDSGEEIYIEKNPQITGWSAKFQTYSAEQIGDYINENFSMLEKDEIKDKIQNTPRLVLVYLSRTCKYCKYILTILKRIDEAYEDVEFYIIDYSKNTKFYIDEMDIPAIPRIVIYIDGEEISKFGFQPDIADFIRNFAPLD